MAQSFFTHSSEHVIQIRNQDLVISNLPYLQRKRALLVGNKYWHVMDNGISGLVLLWKYFSIGTNKARVKIGKLPNHHFWIFFWIRDEYNKSLVVSGMIILLLRRNLDSRNGNWGNALLILSKIRVASIGLFAKIHTPVLSLKVSLIHTEGILYDIPSMRHEMFYLMMNEWQHFCIMTTLHTLFCCYGVN